ncbi:MAG: hypothetical protein AAGA29_02665 [Planctomycetota bacterium]
MGLTKTKVLLAVLLSAVLVWGSGPALAQNAQAGDEVTAENEPSLDDLLGTGGDDDGDDAEDGTDVEPGGSDDEPDIDRALEQRLNGEEAADQFAQAVQDMEVAAARIGEDQDAGIDTQRLQDEIILRLEQIIASAQKSESESSSSSSSQQQQQQARQADRGGQQQGEQQGEGGQPAQQQGEGAGEQDGQQPGEGDRPGQGDPQRGDVRNAELSMEELREGEWGNLPPRLRDELAESLGETFNPVYRAITEAYYRRIAELSRQQAEDE